MKKSKLDSSDKKNQEELTVYNQNLESTNVIDDTIVDDKMKNENKNINDDDDQIEKEPEYSSKKNLALYKISKMTSLILMLVIFPFVMISIGVGTVANKASYDRDIDVNDIYDVNGPVVSGVYDIYDNVYDVNVSDLTSEVTEEDGTILYENVMGWGLVAIDTTKINIDNGTTTTTLHDVLGLNNDEELMVLQVSGTYQINSLDNSADQTLQDINNQFVYSTIQYYNLYDDNGDILSEIDGTYPISYHEIDSGVFKDSLYETQIWIIVISSITGAALLASLFGWFWFSKYNGDVIEIDEEKSLEEENSEVEAVN